MNNPNKIVRVRARNGGRASVHEANGWCQSFTSGLLEGQGVVENKTPDMQVLVGGSTGKPDVVIAEDPHGYKVAIDIIGQQPVTITAPGEGATQTTLIVVYTDDIMLTSKDMTETGSPSSCGLITVSGTPGQSADIPTDEKIRQAIQADGATGGQAAYAILAKINLYGEATTIENKNITICRATLLSSQFADASILSSKIVYDASSKIPVIDASQKLQEWGTKISELDWTADENCYVTGHFVYESGGALKRLYVDDVMMAGLAYSNIALSNFQLAFGFFVGKGQHLQLKGSSMNGSLESLVAYKIKWV